MSLDTSQNSCSTAWAGENSLSRREIFVWLACILLASKILSPHSPPPEQPLDILQTLLSKSVFFFLGWYVVLNLLLGSDPERPASRSDVSIAFGGALLNLIPFHSSSWLATTSVGLWLLLKHSDSKIRAAATVLLALAFNGYWGPKLFAIFGYYILRTDAMLVGAALAATQPGMDWHETVIGRPGGHSVLIYSPCSSFHNVSLGLLCWVSITKFVRTSWARLDLAVALAVCGTVILFNATRLYLMALSGEHYIYWHGGVGEHVITAATTIVVLLISLWGALHLGKSQCGRLQ